MQRCIAKNLAVTTITAYEVFFRSVETFLKNEDKLNNIETLIPADIRRYFIFASNTMIGITQAGYYRRLNTFFRFLVNDGILRDNPMLHVEKPKVAKRIIKTFNINEVNKMMGAYNLDTFIGRRNYTILALLLATGLRRSEYIKLSMLDVDLNNAFIRGIGKGDKERLLPISKGLMVILKKYLASRKEFMKDKIDSPAFFVTRYGSWMTKECSNSIFRNLKIDLKLEGKRISAHTWRHTFAKAFLLNGGDVFTLQELLGHADIETTKIYVNLTDSEKKQQNKKYNPLDNMNWQYY